MIIYAIYTVILTFILFAILLLKHIHDMKVLNKKRLNDKIQLFKSNGTSPYDIGDIVLFESPCFYSSNTRYDTGMIVEKHVNTDANVCTWQYNITKPSGYTTTDVETWRIEKFYLSITDEDLLQTIRNARIFK